MMRLLLWVRNSKRLLSVAASQAPAPSPEKASEASPPKLPPWASPSSDGDRESEATSIEEGEYVPPVHYKPRKKASWLYEVMAAAPFCDGLSDQKLDEVVNAMAPLKCGAGFGLAFQGAEPERFAVVEEGFCEIDGEGLDPSRVRAGVEDTCRAFLGRRAAVEGWPRMRC